jgi:3-methyladenine DNA glycosylase AlkC
VVLQKAHRRVAMLLRIVEHQNLHIFTLSSRC